ncbi:alpha-1,3-mannosyl-glycoprotein 4-beta-N-acetylglucosaminyltransferase B-like isoform X1 [Chiloscyllium plagiosum]|uniref:alpha-1,3-mannosyl-glycoprotein 4-beta-N-acetylglucosaminyltransferase B-like isoform X1 n=2 Tax=Chiloscyllium plagiosum TaxID=36176 RepID=UPI001CB7B4D5|nr:alpha-1,3-mannosyl-glycoprotein 4-beta-N-acetylglucosaminyltransferase B-like isoform X1 [Chiloscyllium plagiosum]
MKFRNESILTVLVLGTFLSMSWFVARLNMQEGDYEMIAHQHELLELSNRMHMAEKESLKHSEELKLVLNKIKQIIAVDKKTLNNTSRNFSNFSDIMKMKALNLTRKHNVQQPNIFYYLPHLMLNENSLQPKEMIGQGRTGALLVMGVPTVKRESQTYLLDTLNSLIYELSPEEKKKCVIVVFIAEVEEDYVNKLVENLQNTYSNEIQSGLLEIISPSADFYPDLSNLKETFGDTQQRVRWRTKQNLDYSFLMMYAQAKGVFYLQLEDDIIATPNYLQTMMNFAEQQPSDDWLTLEFSQLGFIGKLFKSPDLTLVIEFIIMFYKDKPIDWLLDHILWVKVCNPEKDAKHCDRQKANLRIRYKPSLFQHVGTHSSLVGKLQPLKDKDFKKGLLHKGHTNPTAELTCSLKIYQQHSLEKAYQGDDFFWAFTPMVGDFIKFRFYQPLKIERYLFRSGNMEHPGDKFFNTTVEILPVDKSEFDKNVLHNNITKYLKYQETEDGYYRIGAFRNGIAEGEVDASIGKIEALRLFVLSESPVWVLLSEIFIKPAA